MLGGGSVAEDPKADREARIAELRRAFLAGHLDLEIDLERDAEGLERLLAKIREAPPPRPKRIGKPG